MRGIFLYFTTSILILSALVIPIIPDNVSAVGTPTVIMKFNEGEEEQIAEVAPGSHGTVTFPGTVSAEIPAGSTVQEIVVELTGYTGMNWPTTMEPSTFTLEPGGEESFTATVSVPPETSYYVTDTLTIQGTARANPGTMMYAVDPIQGSIRIAQFYKFSLESYNPYEEIELGDQVTYDLKIWNYGNGRDTYSIQVKNLRELNQKNIAIIMGANSIQVDEKSNGYVTISVVIPLDKSCIGTRAMEVEVKSEQQEEMEGETILKSYIFTMEIVEGSGSANDGDGGSGSSGPADKDDKRSGSSPGFEALSMVIAIGVILAVMIVKRRREVRK